MILTTEPGTPRLRVLTDDQCQTLFEAALTCLADVGVRVENVDSLNLLAQAGARLMVNISASPFWRNR